MIEATDYRITVQRRDTEDGRMFEGTVYEFPDIAVFGETFEEAYELAVDAIDALAQLLADQGRPIPDPAEPEREYSGNFVVRAPKWVHRDLVRAAAEQDTSLNQYVVSVLSAHAVVTKPAAHVAMHLAVLPRREAISWSTSGSLAFHGTERDFGLEFDDPDTQMLVSGNVLEARRRA